MRRSTLLLLTSLLGLVLAPAMSLAGEPPRDRLNTGPAIEGPVPPTIPPEFNICNSAVPIADGERFFVGVVYHRITELFGPDWFIGRNVMPGFPDHAYGNLSGQHGDWMDLHNIGLGNRWGIIMNILTDCGPVSVEPSSWGAVKALWR